MARKGKKILWHKKSGKLISSKFAAARGARVSNSQFTGNLKDKIRQAVEAAHKIPLARD